MYLSIEVERAYRMRVQSENAASALTKESGSLMREPNDVPNLGLWTESSAGSLAYSTGMILTQKARWMVFCEERIFWTKATAGSRLGINVRALSKLCFKLLFSIYEFRLDRLSIWWKKRSTDSAGIEAASQDVNRSRSPRRIARAFWISSD